MSSQRDRILECACDLYLKHGLDGFSMRKLARRVGVTAPAIYRHYEGREAVLADVLREAHRTFARYLYAALAKPTELERFIGAGEGFLNFVIDHPRWYGIMHTAPEHLGLAALPEDIEALIGSVHRIWIDRVRECMDAGILTGISAIAMESHTSIKVKTELSRLLGPTTIFGPKNLSGQSKQLFLLLTTGQLGTLRILGLATMVGVSLSSHG